MSVMKLVMIILEGLLVLDGGIVYWILHFAVNREIWILCMHLRFKKFGRNPCGHCSISLAVEKNVLVTENGCQFRVNEIFKESVIRVIIYLDG